MIQIAVVLLVSSLASAWDPWKLAQTPPMGFANWNGFGCHYNDTILRGIADAMVETGMRDAGYDTIIIQECITKAGHRDRDTGVPQPDPEKFPNGMSDLVSYIHSKGLKAGIYTDVGPQTCANYEGSYGHEDIDALTYAQWGFDLVEEDACHYSPDETGNASYEELYMRMHEAILKAHEATGKEMLLYACVWGHQDVYKWGPAVAGLWRSTEDIFYHPGHPTWAGMLRNFRGDTRFPNATQIGAWQDPDMLVVGMPSLTPMEWRTHFSLWAMAAAPLWAGIDLRDLPAGALEVFTNREVIAVDQDSLGIMATSRTCDASSFAPVRKQPQGLKKHPGVDSPEECQAACCETKSSTWSWSTKAKVCFIGEASFFTESDEWIGGQLQGEVWQKQLQPAQWEETAVAVLLLNAAGFGNVSLDLDFQDVGMDLSRDVVVRDLWEHYELRTREPMHVDLLPHASLMLRVSQASTPTRPVSQSTAKLDEERLL